MRRLSSGSLGSMVYLAATHARPHTAHIPIPTVNRDAACWRAIPIPTVNHDGAYWRVRGLAIPPTLGVKGPSELTLPLRQLLPLRLKALKQSAVATRARLIWLVGAASHIVDDDLECMRNRTTHLMSFHRAQIFSALGAEAMRSVVPTLDMYRLTADQASSPAESPKSLASCDRCIGTVLV